eukprot:jgi/Botrbrau1/8383/Bobra.0237s0006.1
MEAESSSFRWSCMISGRHMGLRYRTNLLLRLPSYVVFMTMLQTGRALAGQATNWGQALQQGDAALAKGEYHAALRHYSSAITGDAPGALPYTKRAAVHVALGDFRAALRDYDLAIEAEPQTLPARLQRARLNRRLCHFEAAAADVGAVLAAKPTHAAAVKEAAQIEEGKTALQFVRAFTSLGDRGGDELRQYINKVLAVAPDCAEAKMMEARLMFLEGNYGGVVALAGQIVKGDSTHVDALVLRAEAYLHIADLPMAKRQPQRSSQAGS